MLWPNYAPYAKAMTIVEYHPTMLSANTQQKFQQDNLLVPLHFMCKVRKQTTRRYFNVDFSQSRDLWLMPTKSVTFCSKQPPLK